MAAPSGGTNEIQATKSNIDTLIFINQVYSSEMENCTGVSIELSTDARRDTFTIMGSTSSLNNK